MCDKLGIFYIRDWLAFLYLLRWSQPRSKELSQLREDLWRVNSIILHGILKKKKGIKMFKYIKINMH